MPAMTPGIEYALGAKLFFGIGDLIYKRGAAALTLALAFAFMVESMARAQASVVVPIAQMGFVVTALLGFLFLREPFCMRKGAEIAAALAALASLAHG